MHAGIVSAIADSAGGYAGFSLFPADAEVLTVEYKLNLVAPAVGERLIAEAGWSKPGRTLAITRGEVYAELAGRRTLCAIMQQTLMVMAAKRQYADPMAMLNFPSLNFHLGETIDMLRETVQQFAAAEIAPRAADIDREQPLSDRPVAQDGRLGLLGITVEEEYGGTGHGLSRARRRDGGDQPRLGVGRPVLRRALQPRASTRSAATATSRRSSKYLPKLVSGEHVGALAMSGAGRGLRRRVDAAARRQARRPLRAQRQQDVDHQRSRRRHAGRLRQDRPCRGTARHHRLPDRKGHEGVLAPRRSSTSSACAARTPASWCSRIARCRRKTCSARKARGVNVLMSGLDYERAVLAGGPLGIMQRLSWTS